MPVSTDGIVCYGVLLGEEIELPWEDSEEEEWWLGICGYRPTRELFGADGEWIRGSRPPEEVIDAYFIERRVFREAHPLPVAVVCHCSDGCPMRIIAVKGTVTVAFRGFPKELSLASVKEWERDALLEFCETYGIEYEKGPCWWLTSYWG